MRIASPISNVSQTNFNDQLENRKPVSRGQHRCLKILATMPIYKSLEIHARKSWEEFGRLHHVPFSSEMVLSEYYLFPSIAFFGGKMLKTRVKVGTWWTANLNGAAISSRGRSVCVKGGEGSLIQTMNVFWIDYYTEVLEEIPVNPQTRSWPMQGYFLWTQWCCVY